MGLLRRLWRWLADRLGLDRVADVLARHSVPAETTTGKKAWMYVFGSATLVAFLLQVVTGIGLATRYVPAPRHAYESVRFITEQVSYGALLRGMHFFGASAMVILAVVHMARVFLTGSYKFPREFNWLTGVVLLLLTLAMAFTGQLLRWDANGVWGVVVASHYAGRVPWIGEALKEFILAGATIGGGTLTRFYVFHVILMPLLIFAGIGIHVYLVLRHGVSEPPREGRPVDPKTYRARYRAAVERNGRPYFPYVTWREALFATAVIGAVVALALGVGPKGPGEPPDPTRIPTEPKPDWFLLWYYGLLSVKPAGMETFVMVYLPLIVIGILLLLPLVFNRGERSLRRRPWAVVVVGISAAALGVLTELGARAPWVMELELPAAEAQAVAPVASPVAYGAQLFRERGCQYCHAAEGRGGKYGPALTGVMRRLPRSIVTTRIVQGFGDMPAYREILTREELTAILAYLHSLEEE